MSKKFEIIADGKPVYSRIPVHPGEILKDEVEARNLKKGGICQEGWHAS